MTNRYTRFETSTAISTHDASWTAGGNIHILDVGGEDISTETGKKTVYGNGSTKTET